MNLLTQNIVILVEGLNLKTSNQVMERDDNMNNLPKGGRLIFGIFMILVYVGVGLLFIFDVFNIDNVAVSASVGGVLCAYGVWRGYRLYRGSN